MADETDPALDEQREWLRVTLASIGDAVITTDNDGKVTFLNPVAESLTGWNLADAAGKPLTTTFKIVNEETRREVDNPALRALREGVVVGLANHTLLVAKDGTERPIDDSAALIRNSRGEIAGVVLVFRDITQRRGQEKLASDALAYADNIIDTLREPFLVLDKNLRVVRGNRSFYQTFHVGPDETQGQLVYHLGNRQWNIPKLRELLEEVLPQNHAFDNFEVEHEFPNIGQKSMLLNARRIPKPGNHSEHILLAIEDVTQRKRAVKATAHLAAIVASSDDAIVSKTLDGVITSWNQGAQRLFGYTAEEIVGKPISVLIPPERQHEEPAILERIRRGEAIEHYETVRRRKDGSLLDISLTVSPVRDAGGRIIGAAKAARDITDRKFAQRALIESEERQRALISVLTDVPWTTDAEGNFVAPQEPYSRYTGKSWEELRGSGWVQCIHPDDRHELTRIWTDAVATRTTYNAPCREWHGPSEQWRHVIARGTPVLNEDGSVREWVGSLTDVHEAKLAQQALRESETRFRRLFEAAQDGILILDADHGRITDANPFMENLLGYSHEEFIGKQLWQIGLLTDASASRRMVRDLQANGYVRYDHLPLETTQGRQVEVEVIANVYQEDHQPVIQCNIRDITERSLLEKSTNEQAQALADLHRRKDEFLAMLSHELRNPLAPILNAVQLLRMQKGGSELQREAHGIIERQVSQLARLVDDLLEVSRISTGRIHLQEDRIDLRTIVDRAIEATRSLCEGKSQTVAKSLPEEPLCVYADPMRLEQVVVNLINNACKYTDRHGHIWVGLERKGDEAEMRVRDNGIGIAPELLPRIFDLFTQADKSLDRSQGGMGIGLALVQSLVTMHRGRVDALSTVGQGSEFIVRLPLVLSPGGASAKPTETVDRPAHSLKVLVVDDNVDAATGIAMLLGAHGNEGRVAHEGAAAMQVALEFVPDVVLLDIGLPVVNGYEVAKWFRQEQGLENVVLVALTGYGQESDRQRSQQAGFDHHLTKPADFAKVQAILADVAASRKKKGAEKR